LILAAAVFMALTPTWDYDGLMYHLQAPRLLMEQGAARLMPDLWQANGPLYAEMVYALGLRLGSDTFAKLMHVWLGVLFVLGTMALGGRVLRREGAWLSGLLVAGVPLLPFWAGAAYTDLGWAAFETLALVCLVSWLQAPSARWLVLAGICAGLACGTKPLALILLPIACAALLSGALRSPRAILARWATFLLPAALVGAPWYLKNLLLAGNPFYPLVFGGPEWPAERTALLADYLASFGMGKGIWDYAMLPVRVFTRPEAFGTFSRSLELPSLLFIAAPFYAATRRDRVTRVVALVALSRIALWSLGSQQTRFLLPVFPCLAVLSAGSLWTLSRAWSSSRWLRQLPMAMILAWLVLVLVFSAGVPGLLWFQNVVVGRESKAEFLRRMVGDYLASEYIQDELPEDARVLLMWDGRGFYCDERCLPDAEQSRWTWYFQRTGTVAGMAALLEAEGITHLYHSFGDSLFILEHDRSGANRLAEEFFLREFRRRCTRLLSPDPATEIYELTCRGGL
jgi:4-amino-4-deoxy-L-arabinose transferase-like glycosyltransferase